MDFKVATFLNETRGDRFFAFNAETSQLAVGPSFDLTVDDGEQPSLIFGITRRTIDNLREIALDNTWAIGNREGRLSGVRSDFVWPSNVRSLSVGDLIVIWGHGVWAVSSFGFEAVDTLVAGKAILDARQPAEGSLVG